MKRQNIPMTWETYEVLEHPFGWKVEYWDGQARLTPRSVGIKTRIDFDAIQPNSLPAPSVPIVPAHPHQTEAMITGYVEAFGDSVEFCDWPEPDIWNSARKDITHYWTNQRGERLSASAAVLEPSSDRLIGLALFVLKRKPRPELEDELWRQAMQQRMTQGTWPDSDEPDQDPIPWPHLELLYVCPTFQRQGLATAMVVWGIERLREQGFHELYSTYHICNQASRWWHHGFGFQDICDRYYIRLRLGWLRNEIWRRKKLNVTEGLDGLIQEQEKLQTELVPYERY